MCGPSLWFRQVVQQPNTLRPPAYLARAQSRAEFLAKQENKVAVSPRGEAVAWAKSQVGITENPPGSNRGGKITEWQKDLGAWLIGLAWCGVFCAAVLKHAGVNGVTYRLASVATIEDDAKAGVGPFRAWTNSPGAVMRGDLVVLFGRGVHVEVVDRVDGNVIHTVGGNTSSGNSGSQSNGGGVFARTRALSDVHGFALVNYPG